MTSRDFCFWLQGALELNPPEEGFTPQQVEVLKKHLALAFIHEIDPSMGDEAHQEKLDNAHEGAKPGGTKYQRPPIGDIRMRC